MEILVSVMERDGRFEASALGHPDVRGDAATHGGAVEAVRGQLQSAIESGRLVTVDLAVTGLTGLFGKYRDDETLTAIRDEAYRLRDTGAVEELVHDGV